MIEFKYDTQLLVEGQNLSSDNISAYITEHIAGDCLLAVGGDALSENPFSHQYTVEGVRVLCFLRRCI